MERGLAMEAEGAGPVSSKGGNLWFRLSPCDGDGEEPKRFTICRQSGAGCADPEPHYYRHRRHRRHLRARWGAQVARGAAGAGDGDEVHPAYGDGGGERSEERRVGEECRSRLSTYH